MKTIIRNFAGVNLSLLMKAIHDFEDTTRTEVLRVSIFKDRTFYLIEDDGINITKWKGNIDEFLHGMYSTDMEITLIM